MSSSLSPRKRKPGPAPPSPSKDDRRRVQIGIARGLSAAALARLFGMNRRTFNRTFAVEIENGRTRVMAEMGFLLFRAARGGSVAAMKTLLGLMERAAKREAKAAAENHWEGLAKRRMHERNSPENAKFN